MTNHSQTLAVPLFGVRKFAQSLISEIQELRSERDRLHGDMERLGALSVLQLEDLRRALDAEIEGQQSRLSKEKAEAAIALDGVTRLLHAAQERIVKTEDIELLQEAGVYHYRHPLTDAVAYESLLSLIDDQIKDMVRKDGGAILAATNWTVNGSLSEGRGMVRDFSKLMLRAFNAEADNLVRGLKPYKLEGAIARLRKVAETIQRLGARMNISVSDSYLQLRVRELELTADFLQKQAEEKEAEREERERLREERKVQQEIEQERKRLEKERQHYSNALQTLLAKGDAAGADRIQIQLDEVDRAIEGVDYRAANIRAGYVYVISNIGSFGEKMVKVGMTRRLDPLDRIKELSDASVPFNFDVHALFFSNDAVGIETAMHDRLADLRVNTVNRRREFFSATPLDVKRHLTELAGELLQFNEVPEALEYRQSVVQ